MLRSYELKSTKYCEWRSQSAPGNGRPKEFRVTGNSDAFNAVSDSEGGQDCFHKASFCFPERWHTETGTCALPSARSTTASQVSRTHRAPELLWSGTSPLELIPPQALCAATAPSRAVLTAQVPKSSFPAGTARGLCSLDSYLPLEWGPNLQHEARSTSLITAPGEAQETGPSGIHIHLWRGKTAFLYYTGIILHLFTDKKKVSLY